MRRGTVLEQLPGPAPNPRMRGGTPSIRCAAGGGSLTVYSSASRLSTRQSPPLLLRPDPDPRMGREGPSRLRCRRTAGRGRSLP